MITRGYFIGQIIDEMTMISQQVKTRSGLRLFDIHRYVEDFMKDFLNIVLDAKLENLNQERTNNPGLDLGDKARRIGFQITATKTSDKINDTLEKAFEQKDIYSEIYVLILQEKQGTYTLDQTKAEPFNFSEKNIWDINDLLLKTMGLDIDLLQQVFNLVTANVARVKVELEIPDMSGNYPTDITQMIEQIPKESYNGITSFHHHLTNGGECPLDIGSLEADVRSYIALLKTLPRITRQFYAMLITRGTWDDHRKIINCDYLSRVCYSPDWEGDIGLLIEAKLCYFIEPNDEGFSYYGVRAPTPNTGFDWFLNVLVEFIESKGSNVMKVIGSLDFAVLE